MAQSGFEENFLLEEEPGNVGAPDESHLMVYAGSSLAGAVKAQVSPLVAISCIAEKGMKLHAEGRKMAASSELGQRGAGSLGTIPAVLWEEGRGRHSSKGPIVTKTARKKARFSPLRMDSFSDDSDPESTEEGEFQDEELEDIQVVEKSLRFFKQVDFQHLLSRSLSALHLRLPVNEAQQGDTELLSTDVGDQEFFPQDTPKEKGFPFPEYFESQLKAEWAKPTVNRQVPCFLKKL
uniref:Uncharacterized protein n=1 Tax=Sphaerodactylus townsendi TaxID=933632 RepID=A0ACB8EQP2_9SAUR